MSPSDSRRSPNRGKNVSEFLDLDLCHVQVQGCLRTTELVGCGVFELNVCNEVQLFSILRLDNT
jgi:hypothetical protein